MNSKTIVYLALRAGFRTPQQIKKATGLLVSQVRANLTALAFDGSVRSAGGLYFPAEVQL